MVKNIQKYLILPLSTVLFVSFYIFAMETSQGIDNTSGHSMEEELKQMRGDISGEEEVDAITKQQLISYIERVKNINEGLNEKLSEDGFELSEEKYNRLKYVQEFAEQVMTMANDMYLGIIPIDLQSLNKNINILAFIYRSLQ
jgi:hypothetical protein